jgi:hypothetical protein
LEKQSVAMFARFRILKVGPAGSFVEKMKNLQVSQKQEIFYY